MKAPALVAVVVALHVVAISALFLVQGCGTTREATPPPAPALPPPAVVPPAPPARPVPPPPPPRVAPSAEKADTVEYVVVAGDTLSRIAAKYKVSARQIAELNKISDASKIRVGQKLLIPAKPGITLHTPAPSKSAKPAVKISEAAKVGANEYVVQAGDTLGGIAKKFGMKVSALREINKLDGDKIFVGQKLKVAEASAAAPAEKPAAPAPTAAPSVESVAPAASSAASPAALEKAPVVAPAPVQAPASDQTASAGSGQEIVHVVMPNEDLDYIARLYVVSADDIVKLNNLTDRKVQPGQRLRIP